MEPFPSFYNPSRIGTLYYPDLAAIAQEASRAGLPPASHDDDRVMLLLIDMQIDFCHEQGALYVPGAKGDIRRMIEFIFRHAGRISQITCSLDSHVPFQIFHPAWWVDANGRHPEPFTPITYEDVEQGVWRPLHEAEWSCNYVKELEQQAKKQLFIWPYHVQIGAMGHALDPELWSAVFWHALARGTQPVLWTKGSIPKTEHYSVLKPEIPVPEEPKGGLSEDFVDALRVYDHILIAGEAESHCVLETAEDLVAVFGDQPEKLKRIYILRDCTSPVVLPGIDFHAIALKQFKKFQEQGVQFINSTDALPF